MAHTTAEALRENFLGNSPIWYKQAIIGFLIVNPIIAIYSPYVAGWALVLQFIFTLAMALKCYPLQPGGLLVTYTPSITQAVQVREALKVLGLGSDDALRSVGIRLIQLLMPVPLDRHDVRRFAEGLTDVLIVEEKNPTLELRIRDSLYDLVVHDKAGERILEQLVESRSGNIMTEHALRRRRTTDIAHADK